MSNTVYVLLGTNQGDRIGWMQQCINLLQQKVGTIISRSSIYQTAAWGLTDQPDFLNMAVGLQTELDAEQLLKATQEIEQKLGRQRDMKWGPRTLDIDILLFNHEIIDTPSLKVPHPYMQERRFALVPLKEIAGNYTHPVYSQTIEELLANCPDKLEVKLFDV
jgi:2-amino-4-hydroxy-6-hydroxymethyldihydropteridine diphosphokinase